MTTKAKTKKLTLKLKQKPKTKEHIKTKKLTPKNHKNMIVMIVNAASMIVPLKLSIISLPLKLLQSLEVVFYV